MKKTLLLITALALMTTMLSAQSRGGQGGGRFQDPAESVAMYDESLDLTDEQEAAFLEILTGFNEELQNMMDSGSRDRDKMMTLMEQRDRELTSLLNESQIPLFNELNNEMMAGRGGAR